MADFKIEFNLTKDKLSRSLTLYTGSIDILHEIILEVLPKYRISSEERLAGFIDQFEYKSKGFSDLQVLQPTDPLQLRQFSFYLKKSIPEAEEYAKTLKGAIDFSGWIWNINYLNIVADNKDFKNLTKRINLSEENVDARQSNFVRICSIFKE